MKILVTGGGTAGHVTPLLAVASEIAKQQPDAKIRYIGKYNDPMSAAVSDHSSVEKEYKIFAGKLRRFHGKKWYWYFGQPKLVLHNIKDGFLFAIGFLQSVGVLLFWRPKVVFVKGGYVGLPVGLAAALLHVPIVTHDSDALPGLTNRVLSRFAKALAVAAPVELYPQYANKNVQYTGVPVRDDFLHPPTQEDARQSLGVSTAKDVVVIVGGSLGAVRVNTAIMHSLADILVSHDERAIYWFTGVQNYEEVDAEVQASGFAEKVVVKPYTDDLPTVFAAATIVITRAGATTLAELSIMKKPTIVIPNPLLTGGHQTKNAQMLAEKHAVIVVNEDSLEQLPKQIDALLANKQLQADISANFAQFSVATAAQQIAALILHTAKR